jgi:hypothetical protein
MGLEQEPPWVFPLVGLDIGQSFWVPTLRPAEMLYRIDTCAKEVGIRVKSYPMMKDGYLGIRTWRIR